MYKMFLPKRKKDNPTEKCRKEMNNQLKYVQQT